MRACIAAQLILVSLALYDADFTPTIHYSNAQNFEHIDLKLIADARHEMGMVVYVVAD